MKEEVIIAPNRVVFGMGATTSLTIIRTAPDDEAREEILERLNGIGKEIKYYHRGDGETIISGPTIDELNKALTGLEYDVILSM